MTYDVEVDERMSLIRIRQLAGLLEMHMDQRPKPYPANDRYNTGPHLGTNTLEYKSAWRLSDVVNILEDILDARREIEHIHAQNPVYRPWMQQPQNGVPPRKQGRDR